MNPRGEPVSGGTSESAKAGRRLTASPSERTLDASLQTVTTTPPLETRSSRPRLGCERRKAVTSALTSQGGRENWTAWRTHLDSRRRHSCTNLTRAGWLSLVGGALKREEEGKERSRARPEVNPARAEKSTPRSREGPRRSRPAIAFIQSAIPSTLYNSFYQTKLAMQSLSSLT